MDFGSILLIGSLAVLVMMFVSRPFFGRGAENKPLVERKAHLQEEHVRSGLLAERDRLLTALRELEFDQTLGKIPAEDYPVQRAYLMQQAAHVLRQLDALNGDTPADSAEERLENAVAVRPVSTVPSSQPKPNAAEVDELEAQIAARRRSRQEKSAGFCPKCGKPVQKSDQFCSRCGTVV